MQPGLDTVDGKLPADVSILIQPEGRMQRGGNAGNAGTEDDVSILIQPEGRMQPAAGSRARPEKVVSILIQPEGRMQPTPSRRSAASSRFQSSSSPKAGCNRRRGRDVGLGYRVSILIQPEGRMQLRRLGAPPSL